MKKIFVWPLILSVYYILHLVYEISRPCTGARLMTSCAMDRWFWTVMVGESIVLYFIVAFFIHTRSVVRKTKVSVYAYIFVGIVLTIVMFGGMLMHNDALILLSAPFWLISFGVPMPWFIR